uniref:Uncharacterized protein n=1 Tax=Chromera velia CCMP2878 TaxID=1169474 RepID=A0A0G4GNM1_9ALVE|eukprot:Cvel_4963.t1-p1 / transcript=Cvel_4963.t1 / gene=Cvel_4963 / organism=Chromera_velia_CCMP2878 / gene_product=Serine/arginine repetitive matrix protein 2, putative / transcript_product=Serine/arginine repetitive matrix protein 2, putative / location=Cvel_scaffold224:79956-85368(-) / protein_length=1329 / sequence_SO=supercontig / SO=protein_coding / is_pseudo=false
MTEDSAPSSVSVQRFLLLEEQVQKLTALCTELQTQNAQAEEANSRMTMRFLDCQIENMKLRERLEVLEASVEDLINVQTNDCRSEGADEILSPGSPPQSPLSLLNFLPCTGPLPSVPEEGSEGKEEGEPEQGDEEEEKEGEDRRKGGGDTGPGGNEGMPSADVEIQEGGKGGMGRYEGENAESRERDSATSQDWRALLSRSSEGGGSGSDGLVSRSSSFFRKLSDPNGCTNLHSVSSSSGEMEEGEDEGEAKKEKSIRPETREMQMGLILRDREEPSDDSEDEGGLPLPTFADYISEATKEKEKEKEMTFFPSPRGTETKFTSSDNISSLPPALYSASTLPIEKRGEETMEISIDIQKDALETKEVLRLPKLPLSLPLRSVSTTEEDETFRAPASTEHTMRTIKGKDILALEREGTGEIRQNQNQQIDKIESKVIDQVVREWGSASSSMPFSSSLTELDEAIAQFQKQEKQDPQTEKEKETDQKKDILSHFTQQEHQQTRQKQSVKTETEKDTIPKKSHDSAKQPPMSPCNWQTFDVSTLSNTLAVLPSEHPEPSKDRANACSPVSASRPFSASVSEIPDEPPHSLPPAPSTGIVKSPSKRRGADVKGRKGRRTPAEREQRAPAEHQDKKVDDVFGWNRTASAVRPLVLPLHLSSLPVAEGNSNTTRSSKTGARTERGGRSHTTAKEQGPQTDRAVRAPAYTKGSGMQTEKGSRAPAHSVQMDKATGTQANTSKSGAHTDRDRLSRAREQSKRSGAQTDSPIRNRNTSSSTGGINRQTELLQGTVPSLKMSRPFSPPSPVISAAQMSARTPKNPPTATKTERGGLTNRSERSQQLTVRDREATENTGKEDQIEKEIMDIKEEERPERNSTVSPCTNFPIIQQETLDVTWPPPRLSNFAAFPPSLPNYPSHEDTNATMPALPLHPLSQVRHTHALLPDQELHPAPEVLSSHPQHALSAIPDITLRSFHGFAPPSTPVPHHGGATPGRSLPFPPNPFSPYEQLLHMHTHHHFASPQCHPPTPLLPPFHPHASPPQFQPPVYLPQRATAGGTSTISSPLTYVHPPRMLVHAHPANVTAPTTPSNALGTPSVCLTPDMMRCMSMSPAGPGTPSCVTPMMRLSQLPSPLPPARSALTQEDINRQDTLKKTAPRTRRRMAEGRPPRPPGTSRPSLSLHHQGEEATVASTESHTVRPKTMRHFKSTPQLLTELKNATMSPSQQVPLGASHTSRPVATSTFQSGAAAEEDREFVHPWHHPEVTPVAITSVPPALSLSMRGEGPKSAGAVGGAQRVEKHLPHYRRGGMQPQVTEWTAGRERGRVLPRTLLSSDSAPSL